MDRGQRFVLAIAIFIVIAMVIMIFLQNYILRGLFLVLDLVVLLRVLYQIMIPPERKRAKDGVCETRLVPELEVDADGTTRENLVPAKGRKAKRSVSVRLDDKRAKKDD